MNERIVSSGGGEQEPIDPTDPRYEDPTAAEQLARQLIDANDELAKTNYAQQQQDEQQQGDNQ